MTSYALSKVELKKDYARDEKLTDFGKAVLKDRYLASDERSPQDCFARVASFFSDNQEHAQRLYDYISNLWFMPATPILSNGGIVGRGLPISCFLNSVPDSLEGISENWMENVWLSAKGGGVGTYWGRVRSIGEVVSKSGHTSGVIPFICVQDALTLAISQGSCRRGASAAYMPVWHPEIEEFIEIRRPTGGDPARKCMFVHNAVVITDSFMRAVADDGTWDLVSPRTRKTIHTVRARDLWIRILLARVETGEPYLLFIDNVNKNVPETYKKHGMQVEMSNLCNEIVLHTGKDHCGEERTAVCCLSSVNLDTYDEWKDDKRFIEDIMRFLDNVISNFTEIAPKEMDRARYSALRERSVGLGAMGFHSFLQSKGVPWESATAKAWNDRIFKYIRKKADEASVVLAKERGACPDAKEVGIEERFTHKMAVAPTASISIICGNTSPGIEPYNANTFTQKTLTGSFNVRNKYLKKCLEEKGKDTPDIWSSIMMNEGSVQHLDFLSDREKVVFKTAFEIDQRWVVDLAADRAKHICQSQSLNVFLKADVNKRYLHELHYKAWEKGVKGMYYLRSKSLQRADKISTASTQHKQLEIDLTKPNSDQSGAVSTTDNQEECLACQ